VLVGASIGMLQYGCVQELPNPAFKIKTVESDLRKAMDSRHRQGCFVDLWRRPGMNSRVVGDSITRDESTVRQKGGRQIERGYS